MLPPLPLTLHIRRGIDTVILRTAQKAEVISDIESYIDPSTQAWYGARTRGGASRVRRGMCGGLTTHRERKNALEP